MKIKDLYCKCKKVKPLEGTKYVNSEKCECTNPIKKGKISVEFLTLSEIN